MKKLLLSIVFLAGAYGLTFGQQGSQSQSQSQSQSSASDQNWEKIGEKTVDLNSDRGIFNWDNDREKSISANEKYSAIKFKAKDASVNLTNVQVEFDDGQTQDLNINNPLHANSESKVVSLDRQGELDKITFSYQKDDNAAADKAKIEVWGLKSDRSSGMGQGSDRSQPGSSMDRDQSERSGTQSGTRSGTGSQSGTSTDPTR